MNGKSTCLLGAAISFLLPVQSPLWGADRTPPDGIAASAPGGFLEPDRDVSLPLYVSEDPTCARAECQRAFVVPAASGTSGPGNESIPLPHLNIRIEIDKFEHHAVSGGGIETNDDFDDQFWMGWDWETGTINVLELEMPSFPIFLDAGDTLESKRIIFRGQIWNGCTANHYVQLEMHNRIYHHDDLLVGEVTLEDTFFGYGKYKVHWNVTATEDDMVSRFEFTGTLYATCTAYWAT